MKTNVRKSKRSSAHTDFHRLASMHRRDLHIGAALARSLDMPKGTNGWLARARIEVGSGCTIRTCVIGCPEICQLIYPAIKGAPQQAVARSWPAARVLGTCGAIESGARIAGPRGQLIRKPKRAIALGVASGLADSGAVRRNRTALRALGVPSEPQQPCHVTALKTHGLPLLASQFSNAQPATVIAINASAAIAAARVMQSAAVMRHHHWRESPAQQVAKTALLQNESHRPGLPQ